MDCYVGFSYTNHMISKLIATKIHRGYSHVFMTFDWNGTKMVLQANRRGIEALPYDRFYPANTIVKMVKINDQDKANKAFRYCVSKLGRPYGFLAIVAIGLGIHYEDGNKTLICSEYVARALDLKFDKIEDLVTPGDIEDKLD